MNALKTLTLALATALAGGCMTLAPDYRRPAAPVPAAWEQTTPAAAVDGPAAADIAWRDYFTDARLRRVIDLALANNRDLRLAALNVEQARAQYGIQRADLFPAVAASGGQTAQRIPAELNTAGGGESRISRQYSATIGFSAWELDFFGRIRSLNEQALQSFFATEEARRAAQLGLVAEVANTWLLLAADLAQQAVAVRTYETQQRSVELTRRSYEAGMVSVLDLHQAQTAMERARADAALYQALVAQDRNALALLAGQTVPAELLPEAFGPAPTALAELPAGVPSETLVRRPDILQAEHRLRAANANIGAARAAFFPSISLTAAAGRASSSLDSLFEAGSRSWSFIPQVSVPIFEAGRLTAGLESAKVQRDIALVQYEKSVQSAFREVADALAERATLAERLDARRKVVEAAQETYRLSEARYRSGVDSFLGLLDAQRTLYAAEQELIAARLAEASNRVALYRVLGGGWQ
jgi:multidrug efflux system outer membrane protein